MYGKEAKLPKWHGCWSSEKNEHLEVFWEDLLAWLQGQMGDPDFLHGACECSLTCSISLNYPNPSGKEDNVDGAVPIMSAFSVLRG